LQRQTISYCGVGAHHQNGQVEKLIHDIQDQGRTILLHAKQRWPQAITEHLWPYAYYLCTKIRKLTPRSSDGKILQHIFCGSSISTPAIKHLHPFGCPAYVLDSTLQAGNKQDKLLARSRMEIDLGPLPNHTRSVHLILSMQSRHVSPQFHMAFDDMFETIREIVNQPSSHWQTMTGLGKRNKFMKWSQQPSLSDNDNQSVFQERGLEQPTNPEGNNLTIVNTMEDHNDQQSSSEEGYSPRLHGSIRW